MQTHDHLELYLHLKCDPCIGETHESMKLKSTPPTSSDVIKDTPTQLNNISKIPLDLSQSQIKL